jgi:beta-lactamase superfamily II metal-dependent hydrolase
VRPALLWLLLVSFATSAPARPVPAPAPGPSGLSVEVLDVGQGDAILVTSPTGKRMLVDGGPPDAGPRLAAALARRGIRTLDLVVLTHPHSDHVGGLLAAIRQAPPRLVLDPGIDHPVPAYRRLLEELARRHVPVGRAVAGRTIDLGGGARAELLWPPPDPPERLGLNDRSVVIRVSLGEVAFLLVGDLEARAEALLLRAGANRLHARVLKVGHHGAKNSSSGRFLAAVGATHAAISVGAGNDYGHPTAAALARLAAAGLAVRRTDRDGTISFTTDGVALEVRAAPEGGVTRVKASGGAAGRAPEPPKGRSNARFLRAMRIGASARPRPSGAGSTRYQRRRP